MTDENYRQKPPDKVVDRLFQHFIVLYGASRVASMWPASTLPEVKAAWASSLSRFTLPTITAAVRALERRNDGFPPSLPEFVVLCRDHARPEAMSVDKVLPAPGQARTDVETARAKIAEIRAMFAPKPAEPLME